MLADRPSLPDLPPIPKLARRPSFPHPYPTPVRRITPGISHAKPRPSRHAAQVVERTGVQPAGRRDVTQAPMDPCQAARPPVRVPMDPMVMVPPWVPGSRAACVSRPVAPSADDVRSARDYASSRRTQRRPPCSSAPPSLIARAQPTRATPRAQILPASSFLSLPDGEQRGQPPSIVDWHHPHHRGYCVSIGSARATPAGAAQLHNCIYTAATRIRFPLKSHHPWR